MDLIKKTTEFDLRGVEPNFNFANRHDPYSPHFYDGLFIEYPSTGGKVVINIPTAKKDASSYNFFSFRICHVSGEYATNPRSKNVRLFRTSNNLNNLSVEIEDTSSVKYSMPINKIIPEPDRRINTPRAIVERFDWSDFEFLTKSALITIRVPLVDYRNNNVNLTNLKNIKLIFPSTVSEGFIDIDTIEFTN